MFDIRYPNSFKIVRNWSCSHYNIKTKSIFIKKNRKVVNLNFPNFFNDFADLQYQKVRGIYVILKDINIPLSVFLKNVNNVQLDIFFFLRPDIHTNPHTES